MNKVTREHYPASRLPSDLRGGIDPAATVTVTIVADEKPTRRPTLDEIWARRTPPYLTREQIDARVKRSRDEWDD